jgi:sugar lactone lactonase YvrE
MSRIRWNFQRVAGPYKGALGGIAWDGEGVLFSAVDEGRILRYAPATGEVREFRRYTNRTDGIGVGADGAVYGCQQGSRRIVRFAPDGSTEPLPHLLDGAYHNQPNNLFIDAHGSIWFTDPHGSVRSSGPQIFPPLPHASVLRLDREEHRRIWDLTRITFDTRAPKAVLVSPDESHLYVAESGEGAVAHSELRKYPLRDRKVAGPPTVLHTFGSDYTGAHRGISGMCFDAEGNLFACAGCAHSGPGPMIYVFAPSGEILGSHCVPGDEPMNCAFGDAAADALYITTGTGELLRVRESGFRGPAKR